MGAREKKMKEVEFGMVMTTNMTIDVTGPTKIDHVSRYTPGLKIVDY